MIGLNRELLADGVSCVVDGLEGLLDGVFHYGHATANGIVDELELLHDEDVELAASALLLFFRLAEDFLASLFGFGHDRVLGHKLFGSLLRALDNAFGFVLRFPDYALTLLDHALSLLDFVRQRNAKLIDKGEEIFFLDHDPAAHGHALTNTDQLLELVNEVEDIRCAVRRLLHSVAVVHGASFVNQV